MADMQRDKVKSFAPKNHQRNERIQGIFKFLWETPEGNVNESVSGGKGDV